MSANRSVKPFDMKTPDRLVNQKQTLRIRLNQLLLIFFSQVNQVCRLCQRLNVGFTKHIERRGGMQKITHLLRYSSHVHLLCSRVSNTSLLAVKIAILRQIKKRRPERIRALSLMHLD
jgi:hypothetical protein